MQKPDFHSLLSTNSVEESNEPLALTGLELKELVSPISSEEFVDSYFSRTSLNVKGDLRKFDHIFNWDRLRQALFRGQKILDRRYNITASFTGGEDSASSRQMTEADHNQVIELLEAGATICITNIHMADPALAKWAQTIREQLNFTGTVGVNCYISPDASGLPMHYDKRVATTLQIAGKKRWKFSTKPAKAWPTTNEVYMEGQAAEDIGALPPDMEFQEVELEPGDLLCLPAGAWHSARGIGFSLALNLYFAPRNFLDQLIPLLHKFAASNESWRGGLPVTTEQIQGDIPTSVSTYLRDRLNEFNKIVSEIAVDPEVLTIPWINSLTHSPYTGWQATPTLSIPEITIDQRFCVSTPSLRFIEFQNMLIVPCDNGVLKFPVTLAIIFQQLSSTTKGFTIPDVLSWQQKPDGGSTQDELISSLKTLYINGIIKKV
ncbi:MAG: cupin [Gammaproteobacteria bacterium]|nr:MAG: cupin [Gammaproteobacteria bacterium]